MTSVGTPKAGVFAEGAGRGRRRRDRSRGSAGRPTPTRTTAAASCYIEFGAEQVARVDVEFLTGAPPAGTFVPPSDEVRAEKRAFAPTRIARWFGTA